MNEKIGVDGATQEAGGKSKAQMRRVSANGQRASRAGGPASRSGARRGISTLEAKSRSYDGRPRTPPAHASAEVWRHTVCVHDDTDSEMNCIIVIHEPLAAAFSVHACRKY